MASSRMLALLGLLAVAGYQHRDKLSGLLGGFTGAGRSPAEGNNGFLDGLQNALADRGAISRRRPSG